MLFPPKDVPALSISVGDVITNKDNPKDKYRVMESRWVRDGMLGSGHTEHLLRRTRKSRKTASQEFWASEEFIEKHTETTT